MGSGKDCDAEARADGIEVAAEAPEAQDAYRIYVVGRRSLEVIHPVGHRWNLQFPNGWAGGEVPQFAPTRWAIDHAADEPVLNAAAAVLAVEEAKRQGWI